MEFRSALTIIQQVALELGLPKPTTLVTAEDAQVNQLVALLNSAGNELYTQYPWEQLLEVLEFDTVNGQGAYVLPLEWGYALDQTQWDRTNHWPLMGPKTPQEWAWLKNSTLAQAPRIRYRVMQGKLQLHPVPGATPSHIYIEFVNKNWVQLADNTRSELVTTDTDTVLYNQWLINKLVKLKFFELKGFDTTSMSAEFMRMFLMLTGKDKGAQKLSLTPTPTMPFVGPWSIPDGSWVVT